MEGEVEILPFLAAEIWLTERRGIVWVKRKYISRTDNIGLDHLGSRRS